MNKFLLIFVLLPFTMLFSQTLRFDMMVTYAIDYKNSNYEYSTYGISTNDNYLMNIHNNHDGSQDASVYDFKSMKIHHYKVAHNTSNKADNIDNFDFVYSFTNSFSDYFPKQSYDNNIHFDFKKVATEEDKETVDLIFYKNKAKTRSKSKLELQILNSELNLFPLFRFTCLHPMECIQDLNYDKSGLVLSAISENETEKYTLKSFKETSLEIVLPKQ
ncbi:hypothetical protein [Mangrovimonas futianensis]|uniref:hypothetical protein n=1 Tax=Mangrovimonas futianensis TaxID=2895523 RepID=UPI001E4A159C|nr:hypothetical protein [Mangrovimonas futianensis]MCF1422933.1 hypothetical protein [Mangrovimonas futianensis]